MTMIGEEQSIMQQGERIVYQRAGDGVSACGLIMLHGLASNASRWHEFMTHSVMREFCELLAQSKIFIVNNRKFCHIKLFKLVLSCFFIKYERRCCEKV